VTAVLSTSFADTDFRDALSLLDERGLVNTPDTRRQLRLDLQKELIDSNGDIISQFGKVADVSTCLSSPPRLQIVLTYCSATTEDRQHHWQTQCKFH
jgi:hypothetical protein